MEGKKPANFRAQARFTNGRHARDQDGNSIKKIVLRRARVILVCYVTSLLCFVTFRVRVSTLLCNIKLVKLYYCFFSLKWQCSAPASSSKQNLLCSGANPVLLKLLFPLQQGLLTWTSDGLYRSFNRGKACPAKAGEVWTSISQNRWSFLTQSAYAAASLRGPLYCGNSKV